MGRTIKPKQNTLRFYYYDASTGEESSIEKKWDCESGSFDVIMQQLRQCLIAVGFHPELVSEYIEER